MLSSPPILLGQYRPLDSFLHRLDARAKLAPVLLVLVLSLLTTSLTFSVVLLFALIAGLAASRVGWRTIGRNMLPLAPLVIVTIGFHLLFPPREEMASFWLFGWEIDGNGLSRGIYFSLRLLLFVSIAFLVTLTTSPSDLAEALVKILSPLRKIGIPVNDLGLILFVALRFIPVLYEEFVIIRNAQMLRGVQFEGKLVTKVRRSGAILIPVFLAALNRADELALAIQARGYRSDAPRTLYSRSRLGWSELVFVVAACGVILTLFVATRHHG